MSTDARSEYERRLQAAQDDVTELDRVEDRLAAARFATFVIGMILVWAVWAVDAVPGAVLVLPAVAFVVLVVRHDRLRRRRILARRRIQFHERGVANLDGSWPEAVGDLGARFRDPEHAYSEHLDVFGKGSLFHRLAATRTSQGADTLAAWLCAGASRDTILARQACVTELTPLLDLREEVALLGQDAAAGQRLGALPAWGEGLRLLTARWIGPVRLVLPIGAVVGVILGLAGSDQAASIGWALFFAVIIAELLVYRAIRADAANVVEEAEAGAHDLELLSGLLERLGACTFVDAELRERSERLAGAAHAVNRLRRLLDLFDWTRNQLFAPIGGVLLWPIHVAVAIEAWRAEHGRHLRDWLSAVGELEALLSIAGYAFEHPADAFPQIVSDGAVFKGEQLGHPLLPLDRAVCNDVELGPKRRVYVVSGSNMSGKSTLLRTVGTNVALALAGAPVRAASLTLSTFALGASIQVHDSLLDGESRFYAEVSRVAHVVHLAKSDGPPLLFLLDELFHGTNSSDRRTGAAGVVRALLADRSVGLLTTHDLELARIAEDLDEGVINVHFEDQFEDGRMTFDYSMRPGVVTRSNALALMRAVGLDV